jgi:integrase/recombinase XerD
MKHNGFNMGLTKQAKPLCRSQAVLLLTMLQGTRYPIRNRVIALLSVKAGLRAKEIAHLTWDIITDPEGRLSTAIHLRNGASKGKSGRVIPLNKELRAALHQLKKLGRSSPYVITTERAERTSAPAIVNLFAGWYRAIGLQGCSSHSGRRTFITNAARKISTVGGSLRDVQVLAGHKALSTTQRYIEADVAAQRKVVDLI